MLYLACKVSYMPVSLRIFAAYCTFAGTYSIAMSYFGMSPDLHGRSMFSELQYHYLAFVQFFRMMEFGIFAPG